MMMQDRVIDKILNLECSVGKQKLKFIDLAFLICAIVLGFLLRYSLFPIESADYWGFLEEWMQEIRNQGGYLSLAKKIGNYSSPYMYIMTVLSYISKNDLYSLKLVSVLFDYAAGFAVFLIVYQITGSTRKAILGLTAVLLSPTVFIDSAYWCQCDIIYTTFLLYSFYFFLRNDSKKSAIFFAISFCFKLQSVFLLPFYIMMWLKGKTVQLKHYLYVPVIYMISIFPAWAIGRDLKELLLVYADQSGTYPWGTLNYPNIYALLGETMPEMRHANEVSRAGTFVTILLLGCLAYYLYTTRVKLTEELMVTLAMFSVALIVYCLPHMHDRYGFLIDLFAIIYGMQHVKKLPVTCGLILISIMTFMPYLIAVEIMPLKVMAIALAGLIVYVGYDLYRQIQEQLIQPEETDMELEYEEINASDWKTEDLEEGKELVFDDFDELDELEEEVSEKILDQ